MATKYSNNGSFIAYDNRSDKKTDEVTINLRYNGLHRQVGYLLGEDLTLRTNECDVTLNTAQMIELLEFIHELIG